MIALCLAAALYVSNASAVTAKLPQQAPVGATTPLPANVSFTPGECHGQYDYAAVNCTVGGAKNCVAANRPGESTATLIDVCSIKGGVGVQYGSPY